MPSPHVNLFLLGSTGRAVTLQASWEGGGFDSSMTDGQIGGNSKHFQVIWNFSNKTMFRPTLIKETI